MRKSQQGRDLSGLAFHSFFRDKYKIKEENKKELVIEKTIQQKSLDEWEQACPTAN